jgi:hypothetical protein
MLVASASVPFANGPTGSTTLTTSLTAGQIGVVNPKNNQLVDIDSNPSASSLFTGGLNMIYLAQGSFYATDKLGSSLHGGYQETVKSKGINPKYVSAFYLTKSADPVSHILMVKPNTNCQNINCDSTYRLRVDVKGSPALRFLTHNVYQTIDAYTGCCDGSDSNIDPMVVLLQWKEQINESLILNQFVNADVYNKATTAPTSSTAAAGTGLTTTTATFAVASATGIVLNQYVTGSKIPVGSTVSNISGGNITITFPELSAAPLGADFNGMTDLKFYSKVTTTFANYVPVTANNDEDTNDCFLVLNAAYSDTTFGDCSFSPKDHVEYQPIEIYASVVEQTNIPCDTACFGKGGVVTAPTSAVLAAGTGGVYVLRQAKQGKGFGETVIREYILDKEYRQEPWNQDPRMREVLGNTTLTTDIARGTKYWGLHILHSVPRSSNPSGTMDNDQYLIKIVIPVSVSTNVSVTNFITFMNNYLAAAGNPIKCVDEFGVSVI